MASDETPLLNLPLFADDDRPTWRGDINGMNNTIDAAFGADRGQINDLSLKIVAETERATAAENAETTRATTAENALNTGALTNPRPSFYDVRDISPNLDFTGVAASGVILANKLNALPANSRVRFPAGITLNITDGLNLTTPLHLDGYGVTLIGNVPNSSITLNPGASGSRIAGFKMIGNSGNAYSGYHKAINFAGTPAAWVDNIRIDGVSVDGYGYGGFVGYNCSNLRLNDCTVTNSVYAGFQFLSPLNVVLRNPTVTNLLGILTAAQFMQSYPIAFTRDQTQASITDYPNAQNCTVWGGTITRCGWEGVDTHGGVNIRVFGMRIVGALYGISAVACPDVNGNDAYAPMGQMFAFNDIEATDNQGATGAIGIRLVGAQPANGQYGTGTIFSNRIVGMGPGKKADGTSADVNTTNGGIVSYITKGIHIEGNNIIEPSPFGICLYTNNVGCYIGANSVTDPWSATFANPAAVAIRSSNNDVTIGAVRHMTGSRQGDAYANVGGVYASSNTNNKIRWMSGYDLSGAATPVLGVTTISYVGTGGKLALRPTLTNASTAADIVAALQNAGWSL